MKITSKISRKQYTVRQDRLDYISDKARQDKINTYNKKYKLIAKIVTRRKAKLAADSAKAT